MSRKSVKYLTEKEIQELLFRESSDEDVDHVMYDSDSDKDYIPEPSDNDEDNSDGIEPSTSSGHPRTCCLYIYSPSYFPCRTSYWLQREKTPAFTPGPTPEVSNADTPEKSFPLFFEDQIIMKS